MRRDTQGEIVFWSAVAFALALYALTVPDGIPWHAAASFSHPAWHYFVLVFDGHYIALSAVAAAVSSGLIGTIVNRYFGWRVGSAAALVWTTLPWVWNRAITGEYGIGLAVVAVLAAWLLNATLLFVTRKARKVWKVLLPTPNTDDDDDEDERPNLNRIAAWSALGLAVLFAVVLVTKHDYMIGEVASAYARGIVAEAGERIVILNGAADEQVEAVSARTISLKTDDANQSNLVVWVKSAFPGETNLWIAAQMGPVVFAEAAARAHPDRFYTMTGLSTTPENWSARWTAMSPYLTSKDPFVPALRRVFAYEGNVLGNKRQEAGELKDAWELYWRVFTEIEPGNPAACVNLSEMVRRGYKASEQERERIIGAQSDFKKRLADKRKVAEFAARIAAFGPVMRDEKAYEELRAKAAKRMAELKREGVKPRLSPDLRTLEEWHTEMMRAYYAKDLDGAARIARAILARPRWRDFIPAHLVMGTAMAAEGDYVASVAFYQVAVSGTGAASPAPFVHNDYAEVLRRLGRLDEAERQARKAVAQSDARNWVFKLTLAQVLRDAKKNPRETDVLVREVLLSAPNDVCARIRKEFQEPKQP